MNKTWMIIAAVTLALIGFWLFQDVLGSLLGGLVGMEAVRQKKRASKVKSGEADKRQEVHQEKAQEHAEKAEEAHQKAQDTANEEPSKPDDLPPGFRRESIKSR